MREGGYIGKRKEEKRWIGERKGKKTGLLHRMKAEKKGGREDTDKGGDGLDVKEKG